MWSFLKCKVMLVLIGEVVAFLHIFVSGAPIRSKRPFISSN